MPVEYPEGYIKTCPRCRETFKTDNKEKRFCDPCLEGEKRDPELKEGERYVKVCPRCLETF